MVHNMLILREGVHNNLQITGVDARWRVKDKAYPAGMFLQYWIKVMK